MARLVDLPEDPMVAFAAERGERNAGGGARLRWSRSSNVAAQAGLLGLFAVLVAFSLFGPLFGYWVGFALFAAATGFGLIAIVLAHRADHAHRRDPYLLGRHHATLATVAGSLALFVGAAYLGLFYLLLHPLVWFIGMPLALAGLVAHADGRAGEDAFLRSLNLSTDTASCGRCGRSIALAIGRWGANGWLCPTCNAKRLGGPRMGLSQLWMLGLAVLLATTLLAPSRGAAFCEIQEPPTPIPTQVNGTQIEVHLTEGFARVVIIKEFYNPSEELKEGQVFFPLEKGHELITDLRLKIGNVVYNSSAQDRGEALDEFLEALQAGQDAALVQYDPPRDVYWIAVTIPPKQARTTITTLEMPLAEQDGFYAYDYRLSVDARDSRAYLRAHVRVETTHPLEEVRIPTHPHLDLIRTGDRIADAWVNSSEAARASDMQIRFRANGAAVSQLALPSGDRYLRYTIDAADPTFAGSLDPRPRSFLILVDGSGSMGRFGRWALAADAATALVDLLAPGETYALGVFHGRQLVPMASRVVEVDDAAKDRVREFLASMKPQGSTNLEAVLGGAQTWAGQARALGQQPLLFLISDGRVTAGPKGLDLENAFKGAAYETDLPMSGLVIKPTDRGDELTVRNLTHFNHGGFEHLYGDYAPTALRFMFNAIRLPVLRDVRVSFPDAVELATGNPQRIREGGELLVLAKTRGTEDDAFAARVSWPGRDGVERSLPIAIGGAAIPSQALLQREWVLTRIHTLLDRLRGGEDPAVVEDLKAIATANRVVTPYTSLLVTIPREQPQTADGSAFRDPLADFGFTGPTGLQSEAASPGGVSFLSLPTLTPLGDEARRWEGWRRDQSAPLVIDREVDRWISEDDTAGLDAFNHERDEAGSQYPVVFRGNLFVVFEAQGELVGIRDPSLAPAAEPGRIAAGMTWVAFATVVLIVLVHVRREAARSRRRVNRASEEDFGMEG